jgi:hypothetical protein
MSWWFPRRRLSALGRRRLLRLINALSLSARFHATCTYERCIRLPIDARKAFHLVQGSTNSLTAGQVLHFSGRVRIVLPPASPL